MFADLSAHLPPGLTAAAVAAGDAGLLAVGDRTRLLRWRAGRLADVPLPPASHPGTVAVAAAAFDGDGREEWCLAGESNEVLKGGRSGWVRLWEGAAGPAGVAVAAVDRRGSGRYSFLLAELHADLCCLEFDHGSGHDVARELGFPNDGVGGLVIAPLVGDRPDVLATGDEGPIRLFVNDNTFPYRETAGEHGLGVINGCGAVQVFDAGGRFGLVLAGRPDHNRLLTRGVDGTFRDRATPAFAFPGLGPVGQILVADFDNCGAEELLLLTTGEANRLFRHDGDDWRVQDVGAVGLADERAGRGCVADVDGDGTLELLWARSQARLFHVPNANHWLRVKPLTRFGAAACGATVRLVAADRTQLRVIDGGPHEAVAHFGLGAVDRVEVVTVGWPDGARRTVLAPAIRQSLDVPHPDG